jgi:hypothetical protein
MKAHKYIKVTVFNLELEWEKCGFEYLMNFFHALEVELVLLFDNLHFGDLSLNVQEHRPPTLNHTLYQIDHVVRLLRSRRYFTN